MQFSIGLEHAFHSLFYMMDLPKNKTIGIKRIAEIHNLAPAYLSKIFSKLRQSGIVKSTPGIKGGYQLAKPADDISFWDIVEAIEGTSYFFQCAEIREKNIFEEDPTVFKQECPCLIKTVMYEAEELYRNSLKNKSLRWLHDNVKCNFSINTDRAIKNWIQTI